MQSSLRLSALLLATAQGLAVSGPKSASKKPAVTALMESAVNMLKNGATSDVLAFAEETLTEIETIVIPAIINESESDQRYVYFLHGQFEVVRSALAEDNQEVFQLNAEEQELSGEHKTCRFMESEACINKRECEMELYRLWTVWVTEEEHLREIHRSIDGHFCPPGSNGTLHSFRVASVPWMQAYMAQKIVVDESEWAYDGKVPDCVTKHGRLDDQSASCNSVQTRLEEKACQHALKINEVLQTYYDAFAQALAAYNCAVEEIMELERDRKREWVTLQVVNCLLERIEEQNGVPCDDSNGGVTDAIGICEERHSLNVCLPAPDGEPRICLDYPPVPPCPQPCPARDQVVGVCLPVQQPIPCNSDFIAQEYRDLPAVPAPPFSETNPGCNAYPECVGCPEIAPAAPVFLDTCPGYTVDGCIGSDAEAGEHPLTFIRDEMGTADVRCCSIDGTSCASQNFEGGVEFLRNGAVHSDGCIFEVTYQEAMQVCHNAGMRICTNDEMQTCCNTGCWHNHHAIWVDVGAQEVFPAQLD